jgi:hypothetical protein
MNLDPLSPLTDDLIDERTWYFIRDADISKKYISEYESVLHLENSGAIGGEFGVVDQRNSEIKDISFRTELTRLNSRSLGSQFNCTIF